MSKLGSNLVVLLNTETERRNNWTIKFRRLNQREIPIHCYEFVLKFIWIHFRLFCFELKLFITEGYLVNTGRKLNLHKTFRRRPGRLLNVLCRFNLHPVSAWYPALFAIIMNKLFYIRHFCMKEGEKGRYFMIH